MVNFIPDAGTIKVESGNSLTDYLHIALWFDRNAATIIRNAPQESKSNLNIQFVDWISHIVWKRYEDNDFGAFNILKPSIEVRNLFFRSLQPSYDIAADVTVDLKNLGEMRMFVLDRIKMLRVTEERFQPPKDFDLDAFMRHSFKVMHDELHTVKVRISPAWTRWVGEKIWHESQRFEKQPDGSLILTFQVAGLEEIKRWVLSLGAEVVVMEPAGPSGCSAGGVTANCGRLYDHARVGLGDHIWSPFAGSTSPSEEWLIWQMRGHRSPKRELKGPFSRSVGSPMTRNSANSQGA